MATTRSFSDLDLNFNKHPITKDIIRKTNENAIIGSLKNLISTNYNERLFQPRIGSNITAMLFQPLDPITASIIRSEIEIMIANFEPRVKINYIQVDPDYDKDAFAVTLNFSIVNSLKPITIAVFLERLR